MKKAMSEQEAKGIALLIIIGVISVGILILKIDIGIIHFYQDMFWVSLFLIPLSLLFFFIFLIWGIFKKDVEYENFGLFYTEPEFFRKGVIFGFSVGFLLLGLICFLFLTPAFYNGGYSSQALQNLAQDENELGQLQTLQSIFTGQIIWTIQDQVIEETINSLCENPTYPCDQVNQSYQIYQNIKGAGDEADQIAEYWGWIGNSTS